MKWFVKLILAFSLCLFVIPGLTKPVLANPYFYIQGDQTLGMGNHTWYLRLNSDGQQLGAIQTALSFDSTYFETVQINTQNSLCSVWTPADSIPPGSSLARTTPYFYDETIVVSCGISGSGFNDSDGLVLNFILKPIENGNTSFSLSNTKFAYLGSNIATGAQSDFSIAISGISDDPDATPTPTPTPTTSSATSSATVTTTTLFSDVTFEDWNPTTGQSSSGTSTAGSNTSELEVADFDNTVPPPPADMTPRAKATPYVLPEMANVEPATESGEVMAVQSLRDLLIPGKSNADKTVVMVNFITTITFLIILAVILWKMMTNTRTAKLKSEYINEMIGGELSALESKMEIVGEKFGKAKFEEEFEQSIKHIMEQMGPEEKKSKDIKKSAK